MRNRDPLDWLLEDDPVNPAVRACALTDLLDRPADDREVLAASHTPPSARLTPALLEV
jgi:hypothetical protein